MNIAYKDKILMESAEYKGHMYWENYILTNIVRTMAEELNSYTDKALVEMYSLLYGEEAKPLFEEVVSDEKALQEAAQIKGTLLFEEVGERNYQLYLNEISLGTGNVVNAGLKMGKEVSVGMLGGKFLKALWTKLKFLGGGVLGNVGAFLKNGFGWARELVKNGAAWVSKTPIVNVAVPMLMVMGSVKLAKGLVNKLRKKSGGKKMTPQEESQFDEIAEKNKGKVAKARKKVLKVA
jgi:hypothetical protein